MHENVIMKPDILYVNLICIYSLPGRESLSQYCCGGQRTTVKGQFSPSTMASGDKIGSWASKQMLPPTEPFCLSGIQRLASLSKSS